MVTSAPMSAKNTPHSTDGANPSNYSTCNFSIPIIFSIAIMLCVFIGSVSSQDLGVILNDLDYS